MVKPGAEQSWHCSSSFSFCAAAQHLLRGGIGQSAEGDGYAMQDVSEQRDISGRRLAHAYSRQVPRPLEPDNP